MNNAEVAAVIAALGTLVAYAVRVRGRRQSRDIEINVEDTFHATESATVTKSRAKMEEVVSSKLGDADDIVLRVGETLLVKEHGKLGVYKLTPEQLRILNGKSDWQSPPEVRDALGLPEPRHLAT